MISRLIWRRKTRTQEIYGNSGASLSVINIRISPHAGGSAFLCDARAIWAPVHQIVVCSRRERVQSLELQTGRCSNGPTSQAACGRRPKETDGYPEGTGTVQRCTCTRNSRLFLSACPLLRCRDWHFGMSHQRSTSSRTLGAITITSITHYTPLKKMMLQCPSLLPPIYEEHSTDSRYLMLLRVRGYTHYSALVHSVRNVVYK